MRTDERLIYSWEIPHQPADLPAGFVSRNRGMAVIIHWASPQKEPKKDRNMSSLLAHLKLNRTFLLALGEAFIAMLIWSSTAVGAKMALAYYQPLTIAALRYFIGFLLLFFYLMQRIDTRASLKKLDRKLWLQLATIGVCAYTIGNGLAYYSLQYLPASLVGFSDALIPMLVLVASIFILKEIPTRLQTAGMLICIGGSVLFLLLGGMDYSASGIGFIFLGISILGFVCFNILSRFTARSKQTDTLTMTALPLGFGGGLLVILALSLEGLPAFSVQGTLIITWLTLLNTIVGYLLFNHALRQLMAVQVNAIMALTPLSTAILATLLLGESLNIWQYASMLVVIFGVFMVQVGRRKAEGP